MTSVKTLTHLLISGLLFACAPTTAQQDVSPTYYRDCAYVDLGEVDGHKLTREEKLKRLEEDLFGALDKTEDCMQKATATSAELIAGAAGGGAGGSEMAGDASGGTGDSGAGTGSANGTSAANVQNPTQQNMPLGNQQGGKQSSGSIGGPANQGSSAVCDAVNVGLKDATTDAEKKHFEGLRQQYGC